MILQIMMSDTLAIKNDMFALYIQLIFPTTVCKIKEAFFAREMVHH